MKSLIPLILLTCVTTAFGAAADSVSGNYLDLIVTHSVYTKTLWHDAPLPDIGGYWGPVGIAEPNQNGAIRGMTDTMVGYAMLVHSMDNHRLGAGMRAKLDAAGLDRPTLLKYIRDNLAHITAHHKSAPKPLEPAWGFSWQSTLWTGNAGLAVLLVYDDLPDDLKEAFNSVARSEADRVVTKPPKRSKETQTVLSLKGDAPFDLASTVNIDDTLALITTGAGFRYTPAKNYNRRSFAFEQIVPRADWGAWQMTPGVNSNQTAAMSKAFSATLEGDKAVVRLQDGANGPIYTLRANLGATGQADVTATKY